MQIPRDGGQNAAGKAYLGMTGSRHLPILCNRYNRHAGELRAGHLPSIN